MPKPAPGTVTCLRYAILCVGLSLQFGFASSVSQDPANSANFETLAANALSAREARRTSDAIRDYQAAVELRPSWDEGWWYLGTLLYDTDHFAEAIPALHHVVELDPKVGAGWAFLGLCEFETGDYQDAYIHLQSAQGLRFADSPDVEKVALYHLGLLLNLHGEFERSADLLVSAFGPSQFPEQIKTALGLSLLRVPLLPAQVDLAKDALIHEAGETAALLANHEIDAALRNFEQMLRDYPSTPYLHYEYGTALAAASQVEPAELQLREEIRTTPGSALPWIALARLNAQHKLYGQAMIAARQAVEVAPHSTAAFEALAQVYLGQDKHDEADAASRKALELGKQPAEIETAQVSHYALSRGSEVAAASSGNEPAGATRPASSPKNFEDTASLAESARQTGQLERAAALYQTAIKLRSGWQEGWRQLGTIDYMRGHYPEAIAALQQSVALEGKQPDTWTLLGLSEFETRDYKNSLIHLEHGRILGFSGNAGAVRFSRYHLAILLNLNGDFDRAIDLLIPEAGPGPLSEEIQFAMGIALLRIPSLPGQVDPALHALVQEAGEAAMLLSHSYYDRAFPIFEKMVREQPGIPFLHYAYGDALASVSQFDEARTQLREEARLNPSSELAYIRLASIGLALHDSAGAVADAEKAVAIAPESAGSHYVLGRSFLERGDAVAAIRELEAARRLEPDSPKVHFNLARAYAQASRPTDAEQERAEFERLNHRVAGQATSYGEKR